MILEYKMDRGPNGDLVVPSWVECPGFIPDPIKKTFIGFSPSKREYKIPGTVKVLTLEEAQARARSINLESPMKKMDGTIMSDEDINTLIGLIVADNDYD